MNQSILERTDFNKSTKIFYIDNLCFFYYLTYSVCHIVN